MSYDQQAENDGTDEGRVRDEAQLAALQQQLNALQAQIGWLQRST